MKSHVLEPEAQAFAEATAVPPFLYELGPEGARKVLDDVQAAPVDKPAVDQTWITVHAAVGDVRVRLVRPAGATGELRVVLYVHGGGWVLGNAGTHDRLVCELAVGVGARWPSSSTTVRPRRTIRSRSSRPTQPLDGSSRTARPRGWTAPGWPWPVTPSAEI